MKIFTSLLLTLVASSAMAAGDEPATTAYDPAHPLDIAEVISVSDSARECGVVPANMVYVDHQGQTHRVTYNVMGECPGGV